MLCALMCSFKQKKFYDVKHTRTEYFWIQNDQFLAFVWSTSPLNVKISGSKFFHRLSIVASTYSPNSTWFGRSLAKIDFWGGGGF